MEKEEEILESNEELTKEEKSTDDINSDTEISDTEIEDESDLDDKDLGDTKTENEKLESQVAELKEKLLRQMAESENIRNRSTKMVQESKEYAIFSFAKDLVSVMDNFTRAMEHLPKEIGKDIANTVEGIKMTKSELESVFKKHSLDAIAPSPGDKFDYNNHHAISQIETQDYDNGCVMSTMQVGYKIKDRLIRPASVAVAKSTK